MAFYVKLKKILDSKHFIHYEYSSADEKAGEIKIERNSGDVFLVSYAEGDSGEKAKRASWAIIRCWESGDFPEETFWAS